MKVLSHDAVGRPRISCYGVLTMKKAILLSLLAALLGCASAGNDTGTKTNQLEVNVQAFVDPGIPIPSGSSFATVPIATAENKLLEKELLVLVRARLEAKGLRYDETKPDFLVAVSGYMGSYGEPFPRFTDYFPSAAPTTQTPDITGNPEAAPPVATAPSAPPSPTPSPAPSPDNVRTRRRGRDYRPTQYVPLYIRIIDVFVGKRVGGEGRLAAQSVWAGRAQSTGAIEDLLLVAPPLLDELFTEFPKRSGRDPHRIVNWSLPAK